MKSQILSIDVEKNGLHGVAFAVGAVVLNRDGEILDSFRGRCPIVGEPRDFVRREVLPALSDFPETHSEVGRLRADFWFWFLQHKQSAHVFADCGWPSEARFFIALTEDDLENRYLNGPYPLQEVATLLLACGANPDMRREDFVAERLKIQGKKHDPWWDAFVSGQCAIKALEIIGTLGQVLG